MVSNEASPNLWLCIPNQEREGVLEMQCPLYVGVTLHVSEQRHGPSCERVRYSHAILAMKHDAGTM